MEILESYPVSREYLEGLARGGKEVESVRLPDSFDYNDFWSAQEAGEEYSDPIQEQLESDAEKYAAFLINLKIKKDEDGTGITPYDFAFALSYALNFVRKEAASIDMVKEYGFWLFNFLGYNDIILDNILTTDDREVFYMLEDLELLRKLPTEEVTLTVGKRGGSEWRIFRWELDREKIREYESKMLAELIARGLTEVQPDPIELHGLENRVLMLP